MGRLHNAMGVKKCLEMLVFLHEIGWDSITLEGSISTMRIEWVTGTANFDGADTVDKRLFDDHFSCVRVPVLSEQIFVTPESASRACICRTITFP